jgi:hypothetical protein
MAHWRKAHQSASQFNSSAGLVVGTAAFLGALVFIARQSSFFRLTSALPTSQGAARPQRQPSTPIWNPARSRVRAA